MSPPREAYVRAVVAVDDLEFIAGLELREDDSSGWLIDKLRRSMKQTIETEFAVGYRKWAYAIEKMIKGSWPDRAYFIEVGNDGEGWVQIFQPFGLPRNDVEDQH